MKDTQELFAIFLLVKRGTESFLDLAKSYNVRENPLTYKFKLAKYGFLEKRQEFINLHPVPPSIIGDKIYYDTLNWNEDERWKLMFICSTFGSLSTRDQALIA